MLIIHGNDQVSSRELFISLKKQEILKNKQITELSGSSTSLSQIKLLVQSVSLLGYPTSIFIQDFFSSRPSKEKKLIIDFLLSHPDTNIYLWDGKDISGQLKEFPSTLIRKSELPKSIFSFLDTLSVSNFHLSLKTSSPEQILYLVINHLHSLILAKDHLANFPDWKLSKLQKQASKYSMHKLLKIYSDLLEIDYKNKTSSAPYSLSSALELWLTRL